MATLTPIPPKFAARIKAFLIVGVRRSGVNRLLLGGAFGLLAGIPALALLYALEPPSSIAGSSALLPLEVESVGSAVLFGTGSAQIEELDHDGVPVAVPQALGVLLIVAIVLAVFELGARLLGPRRRARALTTSRGLEIRLPVRANNRHLAPGGVYLGIGLFVTVAAAPLCMLFWTTHGPDPERFKKMVQIVLLIATTAWALLYIGLKKQEFERLNDIVQFFGGAVAVPNLFVDVLVT